jgi:NTP-dependent ternary system trypsin peptidase co-occuring protein
MAPGEFEQAGDGTETLVPVEIDGLTLYVAARTVNGGGAAANADEHQIGARERRLEPVLAGMAGFARQVITSMQATDASKVTVQFGCEIAVESGSFVAVIGKASAKSTVTVSVEWATPLA